MFFFSILAVAWFVAQAVQQAMIFVPDPRPLAAPDALGFSGFETAQMSTSDGLRLDFLVRPPAPGQPLIVYFHGNSGNASDRLRSIVPLLPDGAGIVFSEYRGFGGNAGTPSHDALLSDGHTVLDWTKTKFPDRCTILWGESLGTYVAIRMAGRFAPAGVILDAPFTSLVAIGRRMVPWLPVSWLMPHAFDSLRAVAAVKAPIMIVQGEDDSLVLPLLSHELYVAVPNKGPYLLLQGVGHPALAGPGGTQAGGAVRAFIGRNCS